jgi:class 3 adenylate cyclase
VQQEVSDLYNSMEELSKTTTSLALFQSVAWPNMTIPHFEHRGQAVRDLSHTNLVISSPTVKNKEAWQQYAAGNNNWIEAGLQFQGSSEIPQDSDIPYTLHDIKGEEVVSDGPFSPIWQMSPVPADISMVNLDLMTVRGFKETAAAVEFYKKPFVSGAFEAAASLGKSYADVGHPHSMFVQPVFKDFSSEAGIAGHFVSLLEWGAFLRNIPHEDVHGFVLVMKNTCSEEFTYTIEGPEVIYVGTGDHHDRSYDDLEVGGTLGSVDDAVAAQTSRYLSEPPSFCGYSLHVYPTEELHDSYLSATPIWLAFTCALFFVFATSSCLVYDWHVQRRQEKVLATVGRTNKIVDSLFPENVRNQLMSQENALKPKQKKGNNSLEVGSVGLKSYLAEREGNGIVAYESKPIADFFLATTVMFADISGFTAWSSIRQPSQVFQLLEVIFKSFDDIARKRNIFKVETVGDCYVAVAGLPEPRQDHAVAMAQFARECMFKMRELVQKLERTLGPDTGELSLRCGLHSGPVTGGVLRGERARFQLFGDTMNTTARIETTGKRDKIHMSQETADLLKEGNKEHWVETREDIIVAKGKGALQTYWLILDPSKSTGAETSKSDTAQSGTQNGASLSGQNTDLPTPQSEAAKKMQRLIDWNCDLLLQLLRKIVAQRSDKRGAYTPRNVLTLEAKLAKKGITLDEVVEIIPMADFDAKTASRASDMRKIDLGEDVEEQLKAFVTILSKMYRDNPFHCFEHASHVTMSVSKLLSRIVAPKACAESEEDDLALALHDHTYGITSDPLTQIAVVIAALLHDVDHRGVPNFVLIKEDPNLAATYDCKSVAEQNSVDLAWTVLMDPAFEKLRGCLYKTEEELRRLRQLIVNAVMATDIFDKELGVLRKKRWDTAFSEGPSSESEKDKIHRKATIVIEHLIQASDVSHTMQHWQVYQKWNERLFDEMYSSFKAGRMENDPSEGWYKGEIGFFDHYIIPLAKKLKDCGVFGVSSDEYLNYACNNRKEWEKKGEAIVERFLEKYRNKTEES